MITGTIHAAEVSNAYPPAIQTAIRYLKEHDLVSRAVGRYELDGDRMILQVIDAQTGARADRRPEAHRKYIDVQFLAQGEERIHCYPDLGDNEVEEELLAERDIVFFRNRADLRETVIEMTEGSYAIFFPSDIHIPAVAVNVPSPIRKIVIKIRMDSL